MLTFVKFFAFLALAGIASAATADQWRGRSIYQYASLHFVPAHATDVCAPGSSSIVTPSHKVQTQHNAILETRHGVEELGIRCGKIWTTSRMLDSLPVRLSYHL